MNQGLETGCVRKVDSAGIAERLGGWASGLSLSHVPEAARHIARRCIVDTIGVAVAGSRTGVAEQIRAHVSVQYGSGPCTQLGARETASPLGAALANGTAAHALDFDDTSYAGVIHGSVIVLPAVLAAAEHADISGARFLEAFIAGSEAAYGLGLTLTDSHYLRGWWATSTLGAIGAAAGAAKAARLDADTTARAIALAALGANGMVAMLGTDAKPVLAGQAARLGVESALLAAQGHGVPLRTFEDPRGFLALMNGGRAHEAALDELGQTWRLMEPGIAIKRYPVCSAAQAAMELTGTLIAENKLDRDQIVSVLCEVPHLVKISLVHGNPETPAQAQFSMPFAIGCILAFGALGPVQISNGALGDKRLRAAMGRVKMVEADDLNGEEFQPRYPECARVTLTTGEGREISGFLGAAAGMPENPLSDEALSQKFRDCCAFAGWPQERCEALLSGLWKIESAGTMGTLLRGEG